MFEDSDESEEDFIGGLGAEVPEHKEDSIVKGVSEQIIETKDEHGFERLL